MKISKIVFLSTLACASWACASPSVEITGVQQQYPWTNTVDITYNVTGITNNDFFVVFVAQHNNEVVGAITNDLNGTGVGLKTVRSLSTQWQPPFELKKMGMTMTPKIYRRSDIGWGKSEYMIVDLQTGAVTFEGLLNGSQAQSNSRYNTTAYKTSKMVFRLVNPGSYTIGLSSPPTANYGMNSRTAVVPAGYPYYMAIFRMTNAQYQYMVGSSGSTVTSYGIAYTSVRGSGGIGATPSSDSACYKLQNRIEKKMGTVKFKIDIPTIQMHVIASQAGKTSRYFWGTSYNSASTYVYTSSSTGQSVGAKTPNGWGIYESMGGYYVWFRDGTGSTSNTSNTTAANLATYLNALSSIYQPLTTTYSTYRMYDRNIGSCYSDSHFFQGSHVSSAYSNAYEHRLAAYPKEYYPSGKK